MPRIIDPAQINNRLTSVVFGELAIAAGVAGESLTVCYENLPATHFCAMCKFYLQGIEASSFFHAGTQQHIRKVAKHVNNLRLILVQEPRLISAAQWTVQTATPPNGACVSRPAILCGSRPPAVGDLPGPTVVLQGNQRECDDITGWLSTPSGTAVGALEVTAPSVIHYDPAIAPILSSTSLQLRDRQVLSCLFAGTSLVAAAQSNTPSPSELTVTSLHYETVRQLLQSDLVGPCEDGFDQLSMDMVNRANVYMSIKYGNDPDNPFPLSERDHHRLRQRGASSVEIVSRREIADLGNTKSRLVRKLVEYLMQRGNGMQGFAKLGLIRRRPSATQWRNGDARSLVRYLRSWSAKQVRTHFERLQREGLITAERTAGNGPWWYALPEELATAKSAFANLPQVGELSAT